MEKNDKRDLMAAVIIQSVMVDKLKWLGEYKRTGSLERMEGLLDDALRDLVTGTYVLVDEMLEQSSDPNILQKRMAASKAAAQKDGKPETSKTETGNKVSLGVKNDLATRPENTARLESGRTGSDPDMDGAKSDLSPLN